MEFAWTKINFTVQWCIHGQIKIQLYFKILDYLMPFQFLLILFPLFLQQLYGFMII